MSEQLTAALDELCGEDASALSDGESVVELYRCLSRLEAVATRASAAFDAGGEWATEGARSAPAWLACRPRRPSSPPPAGCAWGGPCGTCRQPSRRG